jgi:hypothetical protein
MRNLLKPVQRRFFYRALTQRFNEVKEAKKVNKITPNEAQTVALIFDATKPENRKVVGDFADKLRSKGKKVTLFGFFENKNQPISLTYGVFNTKNVSWKGIPSGDEVEHFLAGQFDLLYDLSLGQSLPLEWISALANAKFKIGPAIRDWVHFDLIVGGKFQNLNHFIEQAAFYAAKITKNHALSTV